MTKTVNFHCLTAWIIHVCDCSGLMLAGTEIMFWDPALFVFTMVFCFYLGSYVSSTAQILTVIEITPKSGRIHVEPSTPGPSSDGGLDLSDVGATGARSMTSVELGFLVDESAESFSGIVVE